VVEISLADVGLVFVLLVLVAVGALVVFDTEPEITRINLTCPEANITIPQAVCICPENVYVQPAKEKVYTSHFQEIITGCASEKPYKANGWDCDRISKECSSRLQNAGYPCHTQIGYYFEDDGSRTNHAWIECGNNDEYLIIESTSGQIVPPWEWERYKAK